MLEQSKEEYKQLTRKLSETRVSINRHIGFLLGANGLAYSIVGATDLLGIVSTAEGEKAVFLSLLLAMLSIYILILYKMRRTTQMIGYLQVLSQEVGTVDVNDILDDKPLKVRVGDERISNSIKIPPNIFEGSITTFDTSKTYMASFSTKATSNKPLPDAFFTWEYVLSRMNHQRGMWGSWGLLDKRVMFEFVHPSVSQDEYEKVVKIGGEFLKNTGVDLHKSRILESIFAKFHYEKTNDIIGKKICSNRNFITRNLTVGDYKDAVDESLYRGWGFKKSKLYNGSGFVDKPPSMQDIMAANLLYPIFDRTLFQPKVYKVDENGATPRTIGQRIFSFCTFQSCSFPNSSTESPKERIYKEKVYSAFSISSWQLPKVLKALTIILIFFTFIQFVKSQGDEAKKLYLWDILSRAEFGIETDYLIGNNSVQTTFRTLHSGDNFFGKSRIDKSRFIDTIGVKDSLVNELILELVQKSKITDYNQVDRPISFVLKRHIVKYDTTRFDTASVLNISHSELLSAAKDVGLSQLLMSWISRNSGLAIALLLILTAFCVLWRYSNRLQNGIDSVDYYFYLFCSFRARFYNIYDKVPIFYSISMLRYHRRFLDCAKVILHVSVGSPKLKVASQEADSSIPSLEMNHPFTAKQAQTVYALVFGHEISDDHRKIIRNAKNWFENSHDFTPV